MNKNELTHVFIIKMLEKVAKKKQEVKFFLKDGSLIFGRVLEYDSQSGLITVFSRNCNNDPPIQYFHESLVKRFSSYPEMLSQKLYGWGKTEGFPVNVLENAEEIDIDECAYGDDNYISSDYCICPSCGHIGPKISYLRIAICPDCEVTIFHDTNKLRWWK